ncbi:saccharopine dehydrogenase family protein [Roseiarcus sp.]|uniref:saccharopine dehydrogenase family protein n=1 Tax=Roseiarcus sp. TaxID=1969460 RepID=UPI003D0E83F4
MSPKLLVYGATGFVGGHIARTAAGSGLPTILAGRDPAKLDSLAAALGVERRAFGLADAGATARALKGATVVLNCAGPFKRTAGPLAGACLSARIPYLDITGEIPVFEALQAKDAEAKARGVMLLPGVGFDVAATDCLALHLKRRLPSATRLRLAFQSIGPAGLPPGTQRTAIELMNYGDRVRRNGRLVRPHQRSAISVDFGAGPVEAAPIPWGDTFTAFFSTGIPNIEVYIAAPPPLRRQLAFARAIAPAVEWGPVRNLLLMGVRPGPIPALRAKTSTHVWGEVADEEGRSATARLHGPEAGVEWTTAAALGAARKALNGLAPAGYQTPASAYGPDFVLEAEGVTREDVD